MAASIQRQTDQQELQCSLLALAAKAGLVLLGCESLIRLSVAYQERMDRHSEIAAVVSIESAKLETLQQRFDRLFSICLLYTSPSPRDRQKSRMPSSA